MSEEKKEPWLNGMSLATVVLAVCATLSTFKGGSFSTQGVVNQALASDQWAFYQSKSTKQHLFEMQVEQFRLQAMALPPDNPAVPAYQQKIAEYQKEIERYKQEKKDIEAKARSFEALRDEAKLHGRPFGLAVIFLQVAILLNSVAGLVKAKRVWWTAIPIGLVGVALFADGFLGFL
ncbi:MAG: DUF4337 domain-containing protein [Proteobacteria bacterium]|nr:DUF4337 domain-containing protein [Pseudomonadota bacterium]